MRSNRPPIVAAMRWVSEITNISLLQLIPVIAGWALDQWLKTQFVFITLGAILGLYVSMKRILEISGSLQGHKRRSPDQKTDLANSQDEHQ